MLFKYTIKKLLKKNNQKMAFRFLSLIFLLIIAFVFAFIAKAVLDNSLESTSNVKQEIKKTLLIGRDKNTKIKNRKTLSNVNYGLITQKNIFGKFGDSTSSNKNKNENKNLSKAPLALIGTVLTVGEDPYAIIESTKDKTQDAFGIGDNVFKIATVVSIHKNKVEVNRDGNIEILKIEDFDSEGSEEETDPNTQYLDAGEVQQTLSNLPLVMTQARAIPYWQDGKAVGLRLFAIKKESIFEKLGLKNGDIIKDINGKQVGDFSKAMSIFEELKNETSLKINLERNKQPSVLQYKIR